MISSIQKGDGPVCVPTSVNDDGNDTCCPVINFELNVYVKVVTVVCNSSGRDGQCRRVKDLVTDSLM